MGKIIDFQKHQIHRAVKVVADSGRNERKIEEQIAKIRDLIGYKDPPQFKIIEGGVE